MTLQTLATIVGILTAITSGVYILIKDLRKVQQKYRLKLKGNWTVSMRPSTGSFIQII